ncbi:MAG TPA: universal stress protein [Chloroflexota bacterium]
MAYSSAAAPSIHPLPAISRILFPTDFSPCSKAAIPYACAIAKSYGAELRVVNVVGPQPLVGPMGVPYTDPEQQDETARRQLRMLVDSTDFHSIKLQHSVHRGSVSDTLCRIVEEDRCDLLVVGTHGRHGVKQFVMGSVAEELFRRVSCPVLTVGPGARKPVDRNVQFRRILFATDLSEASTKILHYVESLAHVTDAELVVFHAVPDSRDATFDDRLAAAKRRLAELMPKGVAKTDTSLKVGQPAELIVETASQRECDLIVIGARRGPRLAAHVPWAVAHEVVCAAPCPVMTVGH